MQFLGYVQVEWDAELPESVFAGSPTPAAAASSVPGKDKGWAEMSADDQRAAMQLGYDAPSWEQGASTPATSRPWASLSPPELAAAQA